MFSPVLRNGNVLMIHSFETIGLTGHEKDVANALAARQRRLFACVGIDGGHLGMAAVGMAESGYCAALAWTFMTGHGG